MQLGVGLAITMKLGGPAGSSGAPSFVAPVITSSATQTVAENNPFLLNLTADQTVEWSIVGGADAAFFSIGGDTLDASAFDYETPSDVGGDNVYNIVVRATNTATGLYTDQAMTVTVTNVAEAGEVPANAIYDRAASAILDRAGAYVLTR